MATKPILGAMKADPDSDVVVFLIGMHINNWLRVRRWLPVFLAMKPMIEEVVGDPSIGCLSARTYWSGRAVLTVQYWSSVEQLISYAHSNKGKHLPAWRAFNRKAASSGTVGIFHETYPVARHGSEGLPLSGGGSETLYRCMPPFGLAAATGSLASRRAPRPTD